MIGAQGSPIRFERLSSCLLCFRILALMSESVGQKRECRRRQPVLRPLSPCHFERVAIPFFRFVVTRLKPKNPGQLHHGVDGVMMLGAKYLAASLHSLTAQLLRLWVVTC